MIGESLLNAYNIRGVGKTATWCGLDSKAREQMYVTQYVESPISLELYQYITALR